jgi:hypothetical protein
MDITISGKVTQILDLQSGTSKNGEWRKQDFIVETEGKYPKPVCITQWGDDIESFAIREGERITVHVDIQSREYNGRWYTDVKAWRVTRDEAGGETPAAAADEPWPEPSTADDDLPF